MIISNRANRNQNNSRESPGRGFERALITCRRFYLVWLDLRGYKYLVLGYQYFIY